MVKILFFAFLAATQLLGGSLQFVDGEIKAHTEVLGDSTIDPSTKIINVDLNLESTNVESLQGTISFDILNFVSDSSSRDKSMYETLGMDKFKTISLEILKVTQNHNNYLINAQLNLHGTSKKISIPASIANNGDTIEILANFSILMSDYGITPPTLLFLTVRDLVEISATLQVKGE